MEKVELSVVEEGKPEENPQSDDSSRAHTPSSGPGFTFTKDIPEIPPSPSPVPLMQTNPLLFTASGTTVQKNPPRKFARAKRSGALSTLKPIQDEGISQGLDMGGHKPAVEPHANETSIDQ